MSDRMQTKRFGAVCIAHRDQIYIIGGHDGTSILKSCEVFDPTTLSFRPIKAKLVSGRSFATAAVINDSIYVFGGSDGVSRLASCEVWDPTSSSSDTFSVLPVLMNCRRYGPCSVVLSGDLVLIIGGHDGKQALTSCEVFDAASRVFLLLKDNLRSPRCFASAAVAKDKIYVIGGHDGKGRLNSCEVGDVEQMTFSSMKTILNKPRSGSCVASIDDVIYVIGGTDGSSFWNDCEFFDPADLSSHASFRSNSIQPLPPTYRRQSSAEYLKYSASGISPSHPRMSLMLPAESPSHTEQEDSCAASPPVRMPEHRGSVDLAVGPNINGSGNMINQLIASPPSSASRRRFFGTAKAVMNSPRSAACAAVTSNKTVYVFGGMNTATTTWDTVELFDSSTCLFFDGSTSYRCFRQEDEARAHLEKEWATGVAEVEELAQRELLLVQLHDAHVAAIGEMYGLEVESRFTILTMLLMRKELDERVQLIEPDEAFQRRLTLDDGFHQADAVLQRDESCDRQTLESVEAATRSELLAELFANLQCAERLDVFRLAEQPARRSLMDEERTSREELGAYQKSSFGTAWRREVDRNQAETERRHHLERLEMGKRETVARGTLIVAAQVERDELDDVMRHKQRHLEKLLSHRRDRVELLLLEHRSAREELERFWSRETVLLRREAALSEKSAERRYEKRLAAEAMLKEEEARICKELAAREYWARTSIADGARSSWDDICLEAVEASRRAKAAEAYRISHGAEFAAKMRIEEQSSLVEEEAAARDAVEEEMDNWWCLALQQEQSTRLVGSLSRMIRSFVDRDAQKLRDNANAQIGLIREEESSRHDNICLTEEALRRDIRAHFAMWSQRILYREQALHVEREEVTRRLALCDEALVSSLHDLVRRHVLCLESSSRREDALEFRRVATLIVAFHRRQSLLVEDESAARDALVRFSYEQSTARLATAATQLHHFIEAQLGTRSVMISEEFATRMLVLMWEEKDANELACVWQLSSKRVSSASTTPLDAHLHAPTHSQVVAATQAPLSWLDKASATRQSWTRMRQLREASRRIAAEHISADSESISENEVTMEGIMYTPHALDGSEAKGGAHLGPPSELLRIGGNIDIVESRCRRLVADFESDDRDELQRHVERTLHRQRQVEHNSAIPKRVAALSRLADAVRQLDRAEEDERCGAVEGPQSRQWRRIIDQFKSEAHSILNGPTRPTDGDASWRRYLNYDNKNSSASAVLPLPVLAVDYGVLNRDFAATLVSEEAAQRAEIETEEINAIFDCL